MLRPFKISDSYLEICNTIISYSHLIVLLNTEIYFSYLTAVLCLLTNLSPPHHPLAFPHSSSVSNSFHIFQPKRMSNFVQLSLAVRQFLSHFEGLLVLASLCALWNKAVPPIKACFLFMFSTQNFNAFFFFCILTDHLESTVGIIMEFEIQEEKQHGFIFLLHFHRQKIHSGHRSQQLQQRAFSFFLLSQGIVLFHFKQALELGTWLRGRPLVQHALGSIITTIKIIIKRSSSWLLLGMFKSPTLVVWENYKTACYLGTNISIK